MTESHQFIYTTQAVRPEMVAEGPTETELPVLQEHVAYLSRLAEAGVVHLAGRTQNEDASCFGIVILSAASPEEAHRIMKEDPAIRHGVMRGVLYPYRVAILGSLESVQP